MLKPTFSNFTVGEEVSSVVVSWTKVDFSGAATGAVTYRLQNSLKVLPPASPNWTAVVDETKEMSANVTNLVTGTPYWFRVTAKVCYCALCLLLFNS